MPAIYDRISTHSLTPVTPNIIRQASFSPTKELAITDQFQSLHNDEVYAAAIVELARSLWHSREIPFERVTFRMGVPPLVVVPLVGTVECYD